MVKEYDYEDMVKGVLDKVVVRYVGKTKQVTK